MEIYMNVRPVVFAEMIGLGPVSDEKFSLKLGFQPRKKELPPLIVQLTTGEIFSCKFDPTNLDGKSAIYFKRNFLIPNDFDKIEINSKIKSLVQEGVPLRLFLGESWEDERFMTWEKCDESILNKIPIYTAFCPGEGYKISRRLELIYEYEFFKILCEQTKKSQSEDRSYKNWLSGRSEIESIIKNQLPWLINSEINRRTFSQTGKPNLDDYDKV